MARYYLIFVTTLILGITLANGQETGVSFEYNRLINHANMHIVNKNFTAALLYFDSAFYINNSPYTIDITNAIKCECITSRNQYRGKITELFKRGLTIKDLREDKVIWKCLKRSKKHNTYLNISDSINKNLALFLDLPYKQRLDILSVKDQFYRIKPGSYGLYRTQIDSIDKDNIDSLYNWISRYGFPSEKVVGVESIYGGQSWEIVLLHYQQHRSLNKNLPDLFSSYLLKANNDTKLLTYKLAFLIAAQNDTNYDNYIVSPVLKFGKNQYRIFKKVKNNIKDINHKRKLIGLDPLEDYIKKILFSTRNRYGFSFYLMGGGILDISDMPKKEQIKFMEMSDEYIYNP